MAVDYSLDQLLVKFFDLSSAHREQVIALIRAGNDLIDYVESAAGGIDLSAYTGDVISLTSVESTTVTSGTDLHLDANEDNATLRLRANGAGGNVDLQADNQVQLSSGTSQLDVISNSLAAVGRTVTLRATIQDPLVDYLQIGTSDLHADFQFHGGEVELMENEAGVIMHSPNGTRYRVAVDNDGMVTTTAL